jgi:beta-aspartyl-peptidase (threonine type)
VVTDTHFKERDRLGRLFAFLAKAQADRPADAPAMIGVGVDESASLAVEPDGTARIYATAPDGGAWLVDGSTLRGLPRQGLLNAPRIRVTGIDHQSVLHLPAGTVDRPRSCGIMPLPTGRSRAKLRRPDSPAAVEDHFGHVADLARPFPFAR